MLLKKLTEANGLPGYEGDIRNIIKEELNKHVDSMTIDIMGNLIVEKNKDKKGKHIILGAHMDEVGLVVKWIEESGLIRFASWGVDLRMLPSKIVTIGKNNIKGVIGAKPIHLQKPTERDIAFTLDDMYIDIGATSKEDAKKHVKMGDYVAFESEYIEFGEHKAKAKALDDRVGCAIIIEILKSDIPYRLTACFNTQEEVGLRGSIVSAFNLTGGDIVINIEGTVSADMMDIKDKDKVTTLGDGPAISLLDRSSVYQRKYVDSFTELANKLGIPYQYRRTSMGGTDAGSFHAAREGLPVIGIAVPCRYIHSPVSVMDIRDYENAHKLVFEYIKAFNEDGFML